MEKGRVGTRFKDKMAHERPDREHAVELRPTSSRENRSFHAVLRRTVLPERSRSAARPTPQRSGRTHHHIISSPLSLSHTHHTVSVAQRPNVKCIAVRGIQKCILPAHIALNSTSTKDVHSSYCTVQYRLYRVARIEKRRIDDYVTVLTHL